MSNATKNGAPRKQLSEQLDRLDGVIDALDEGLKGAVAEAVRDAVGAAVQQAVESVLTRVLTDPELQKLMRQAAVPAPEESPQPQPREEEPPMPSAPPRPRRRSGVWGKVCSAARTVAEVGGAAVAAVHLVWAVSSDRTRTLALGAVAAVGGVAYACRGHVAAAASAAWEVGRGVASAAVGWLLRPAFALVGC